MSSEERYILWNYMLAEHCLLADSCDGVVLLTVTPRALVTALEEAGEKGSSLEDAESDFISAVAAVYMNRVIGDPQRLHALLGVTPQDVPYGVGFLALSVLAAYHMHSDDQRTGRAYYPRLAEMLGCEVIRGYPAYFDGDAFLKLWEELALWLRINHSRELSAPTTLGRRPYLAYPFAHMPLRRVDIERLPKFFEAHSYEPGSRPPVDRLASDLRGESGPWRYLTSSGQRALEDPNRRLFVIHQIAQELERWDGCGIDSSGGRTGSIQLWLDFRNRRARLHMLARRPEGFPETIGDDNLIFSSSHEGWYDPVPIGSEDGEILESGVRVGLQSAAARYFLQLKPASVIVLTPSDEYTGFLSDRALRSETECAVLCLESLSNVVDQYLEAVTHKKVRVRRDDTIPKGWCLFSEVRAVEQRSPPLGLETLRLDSSLAMVAEGGLRLGRRWHWLEGVAPRLTVVGMHQALEATVDGERVGLDENGRVQTDVLACAGLHVVEVGNRLRRKVSVLPGIVNPHCRPWSSGYVYNDAPIAVPGGDWMLVGGEPGQCISVNASAGGMLVRAVGFTVRWAIRLSSATGAMALHIHDRRFSHPGHEQKEHLRASKNVRTAWIDAILRSSSRRPQMLCQHECSQSRLRDDWTALAESAHALRRAKRRRR